jgi:replicative DNA helicase
MENETITTNRPTRTLSYNRIETLLGTTGKLTPQAVEFEEAVLGALMIDDNAVNEVLNILKPDMFYVEANQHIFNAIQKLFSASQPIDVLTVTNQLKKDKLLEVSGGASYIAGLTNRKNSSANVEFHSRIVMEKFILRELIRNCNTIINDAYDDGKDVLTMLDEAETKIFSIVESNLKRDSKELGDVVSMALNELSEIRESQEELQGVPSGIRAIDEKTGGWQKSDLVILAARPGMGKTSFVLSIARNAAIDFDMPIAFFSLEMSASQLVHRLFSIESGIPSDHISKGNLSDVEWSKLWENVGHLQSSNLIIDDTPALSVFDLRAKCRRLKHKYNIQMIIVDYLQLMQAGNDTMVDNAGQNLFASRVPGCTLAQVPGMKHELYMTDSDVLIPYWEKIFAFLG